jgi:zinc protease
MFALRYALAEGRVLAHPADELQILRALLPSITPEALQHAFSEMWGDAERLVFVTTSEALNDPQGEIEHVYRASLASAVSPAAPPRSLTFAHTDFGPPGNVVERTDDTARNITAVRFANNVRLTIQRSSSEGARAHVRVRIAGAAVSQIGPAPGWSYAFSQTFLAGGTSAHTYLELERLKEGRLAVLSLYTDYDSIVLGGETTSRELEFQLQLLAAFVSAPGFRAEAFDAYHRGLPDHYARLRATPLGVFELNRFRILYSGHPRVAYPTENEVRHWTRDNLERLLRPVLSQGPIEIGIVGEVDIEPTIELVRRTFGALAERRLELPDHESDHAAAFAPTGGPPTVLYYEGEGEQGLLSVYWRTPDAGDKIEAATLAVAAAILKQRLIERLRETEGASYSPSASNNPSPYFHGFGYFNVLTDGDAADLARLSSIIEEIVASMSRDIGEAEFEAARRILVNRIAPDPADLLSLDDVTRFQTTQPERKSQMNPYPMITDDQVEDAVRRYLRPERKLEIRILPRSNE